MDFSKSIYSRGGARRSRAQPRPGFASPRSRHPRHHSLTFAPALRCAHPSVHARLPHPGCAPLRPASPVRDSSALRSRSSLVPCTPSRACGPPPCRHLFSGRGVKPGRGWGTARRGLGWAHRPSYPRGYAGVAGCVKAGGGGGGGGRADPPPCVRGRLGWRGLRQGGLGCARCPSPCARGWGWTRHPSSCVRGQGGAG
ncbi:hypothetical protein EDB84DRAFT_1580272, partial [Lactarius hengduanensis]